MISMFDSIVPGTLRGAASTSGEAVAGYVGGSWPDYNTMAGLYPHDNHLSIAVNAGEDADCLDVERGDAAAAQAPDWVRRQHGRGIRRPVVYANLSTMPSVEQALSAAGIPRTAYRLWVADYTYVPHIPGGYDACQWTDHAFGRNLDESLCLPDFFETLPGQPAAAKAPVKAKRHPVRKVAVKMKKTPAKVKAVVKKATPHPKVAAGGIAGVLTAALVTYLNSHGVAVTHLNAQDQEIIVLASTLLAAWAKGGPTAGA